MLKAESARNWLVAWLGDAAAVASHFVAVTAKSERAIEFGIRPGAIFPIPAWPAFDASTQGLLTFSCGVTAPAAEASITAPHE